MKARRVIEAYEIDELRDEDRPDLMARLAAAGRRAGALKLPADARPTPRALSDWIVLAFFLSLGGWVGFCLYWLGYVVIEVGRWVLQ